MTVEKFGNLFTHPDAGYVREVAVHEYYVQDAVKYLTTMTGASEIQARDWIKAQLTTGGKFEFKSPGVEYLDREENGDRVSKRTTLYNFIQHSLRDSEIIAPTFTTYVSPKKQKSLLSLYVEENIARRGKAKKEMFAAESAGDLVQMAVKEVEQKGKKLANNAISGGHVSPSTPLYNKTAHSTLTSTCRVTAGYGNANNEKFLSGNRHYHNYQVVLNNIVAIINNFDKQKLQAVIDKYGIHLPTAQEAGECVAYSSRMYWWDRKHARIVQELLEKLSPLELAAFVYSGDAFHLRKHNHALMYTFLTRLSNRVVGEHPEPMRVIKQAPESYVNLAHQLCRAEMAGEGKEYKALSQTPEGLAKLQTLACTIENVADVIYEYRDLIETFWMPEILPASVAYFPESIRRTALTSDTDSTIFTVQDWVQWYNNGVFEFNDRTHGVYVAAVFLASSTITHVLAKMSANLGVIPEHLGKIQMKSEFSFDVFVPTQLGKHYFACISCQEGNVYKDLKWEIKGAQLRSANAPREIVESAKTMMQEIINTVLANKKISLKYYLTWVADIERKIATSLLTGQLDYLRSGSIKDAGSYAGEAEDSPYQNHFLWNEIFGPKYGMMTDPPYDTYKVSVTVDKPSKLKAWLEAMEDKALAERIRNYLGKNEKIGFGTFHMPKEILHSSGIPKEIIEVIDIENIQADICRLFYIVVECIGYYAMGDKMRRLLSKSGY
jgi:hypothetical protein